VYIIQCSVLPPFHSFYFEYVLSSAITKIYSVSSLPSNNFVKTSYDFTGFFKGSKGAIFLKYLQCSVSNNLSFIRGWVEGGTVLKISVSGEEEGGMG
jgi:hypothetical protein